MAISAIAHTYWRSIKRGTRTFESIKNSKIASVKALTGDVRLLAQSDVENGEITIEEYEQYLGETYPVKVIEEE